MVWKKDVIMRDTFFLATSLSLKPPKGSQKSYICECFTIAVYEKIYLEAEINKDVFSGMPLILTDFQQYIHGYDRLLVEKSLNMYTGTIQCRSALPNVKYYCVVFFLRQMYSFVMPTSKYIFSQTTNQKL